LDIENEAARRQVGGGARIDVIIVGAGRVGAPLPRYQRLHLSIHDLHRHSALIGGEGDASLASEGVSERQQDDYHQCQGHQQFDHQES